MLLTIATAGFELVHVTAVTLAPVTVAVSCAVAPGASTTVVGVTLTSMAGAMGVGGNDARTPIVALDLRSGFACDVPVIVAVPELTAVTSPLALTVATAAFDVLHVTAVFVEPVTLAVSCVVPPGASVAVRGVIVISIFGAGRTPIEALPRLSEFTCDFAVIVAVPAATAVTRPVLLTVATDAFEVVHVTAVLDSPVTVAASCTVPPGKSAVVFGLTVTVPGGWMRLC